jgi:hypothetical protein
MKIMNSFFKHKNIYQTHSRLAMTEHLWTYYMANRKLSELFLHVRVHRESDTCSECFLTLAKLRFPPKKGYIYPGTLHTKKYISLLN